MSNHVLNSELGVLLKASQLAAAERLQVTLNQSKCSPAWAMLVLPMLPYIKDYHTVLPPGIRLSNCVSTLFLMGNKFSFVNTASPEGGLLW